jgi:hypothetical protein
MKSLFPAALGLVLVSSLAACGSDSKGEPKNKGNPQNTGNAKCENFCEFQFDCFTGMSCDPAALGSLADCVDSCEDAGYTQDDWDYFDSLDCYSFDAQICIDPSASEVCGCPTDNCAAGEFCYPLQDAEGICLGDDFSIPAGPACTTQADCAAGSLCLQIDDAGNQQCLVGCEQVYP